MIPDTPTNKSRFTWKPSVNTTTTEKVINVFFVILYKSVTNINTLNIPPHYAHSLFLDIKAKRCFVFKLINSKKVSYIQTCN